MQNRILIVDDEEDLVDILSMQMEDLGFEVRTATSEPEAWSIFQEWDCELVLSDVKMPGGSGIDLLEKVMGKNPKAQFYLMSGFAEISEEKVIEKGGLRLFNKPEDIVTLVDYIKDKHFVES